jgi:hypothetical protein
MVSSPWVNEKARRNFPPGALDSSRRWAVTS